MTKLIFPLNKELLEALKEEYLKEAQTKGNSWLDTPIGTMFIKLQEEYDEVQEIINNGYIDNKMKEELKDLLLVTMMVYRLVDYYISGVYKE